MQNAAARVEADLTSLQSSLITQLHSPVLWSQSVQWLAEQGVTRFIESGPGKVLTGLDKRIVKDAEHLSVESAESLKAALLLV